VIVEQCASEELAHIACSKSNCRMSMFLVNELSVDDQPRKQLRVTERSNLFAALSRWWK